MPGEFSIEPLGAAHDRKAFSSGVPVLDRYLHELATQDIRRRISNCFVACDPGGEIAGYCTLASASLPLSDLSPDAGRRLPRYPLLPAALIGRLAIDHRFRKRGLAGALVIDAARRAGTADPAVFALIVDAKDEQAMLFYQHLGFSRFASRPMSLYLALATARKAMQPDR